jgi:phospholipase/carboxylesterase
MGQSGARGGVALEQWGDDAAAVAVLAVHGRAQNPMLMKEYSTRFGQLSVNFFAPHAQGDSWYPYPFLEPLALNAAELDASLRVVADSLARVHSLGYPAENVVVWGFSQGACLLSHYLLTERPRVGGALLFTGGYVGDAAMDASEGSELAGVPVIVRSIQDDPFVPPWRVGETAALLERIGAAVDFRIDPGNEHVITDEAFGVSRRLLEQLDRAASKAGRGGELRR